jgi:hypothetical protein
VGSSDNVSASNCSIALSGQQAPVHAVLDYILWTHVTRYSERYAVACSAICGVYYFRHLCYLPLCFVRFCLSAGLGAKSELLMVRSTVWEEGNSDQILDT